jgi:hypothetical protein
MMDVFRFFTLRRLRLLSGMVMFFYIAIHLLNHALGIFSLALAESGLRFEMVFWRTPIMTLLLYGAVAVHFLLALWALYSRLSWRLPWVEVIRLASGFSFPLLLINHAVTTRLGDALFGITPSYSLIIANLLAAGINEPCRGRTFGLDASTGSRKFDSYIFNCRRAEVECDPAECCRASCSFFSVVQDELLQDKPLLTSCPCPRF